jgi:hypothetical protein
VGPPTVPEDDVCWLILDVEEEESRRLDHGGIGLAVDVRSKGRKERGEHARGAVRHSKALMSGVYSERQVLGRQHIECDLGCSANISKRRQGKLTPRQ